LRVSEIRVSILSTQWRCGPHLELAIRSLVEMKNRKVASYLMDIIHYKEFETVPGRTTDGVPASPLFARRCLQNAAPRLSPATCFRPAEADHRLWTTVRALLRGLFSAPSTQDLKPTPRVSVILTPVVLLVYEWQIDHSTARHR
jgi:hypothetical protein